MPKSNPNPRPVGRPPGNSYGGPGQRYPVSVQFKKEEKADIDRLAKTIGLSSSEMIRRASLLYIRDVMERYGIVPKEEE